MDLWQWLTLAGAVMLSGISKTSFAGSLGLLAMPLLLLAFPADRALALLLPVLILCDAFTLQSSWNKWDLTALRFLLLPAIIGIVAASFVLLLVTIQQLQLFIGIGATLFALRYFYGNADLRLFAGAKAGISLGFISGVSSTLLHAGGPPLSLHLLARQLPPVSYIATSAVFFAVLNLLKVPAYWLTGQFDPADILRVLYCTPLAFIAVQAGVWVQRNLPQQYFIRLLYLLLLLSGLAITAGALMS